MSGQAAGQQSVTATPLPLAFLGRTSTLVVQDPVSSLRRQVRSVQEKAPPGSFITAWFWDIESGGLDIEQRGHGTAHQAVNVSLPRDGGLAALLAEAAGPNPRFAAVMCEDVEVRHEALPLGRVGVKVPCRWPVAAGW